MKLIYYIIIIVFLIIVFLVLNQFYTIEKDKFGQIEMTQYCSSENNKVNHKTYYLVEKYKYSKKVTPIGFGSGKTHLQAQYKYGFADENKKIILKPEFDLLKLTNLTGYNDSEQLVSYPMLFTVDLPNKEFYTLNGEKASLDKLFSSNAHIIVMDSNGLDYYLYDIKNRHSYEISYSLTWINSKQVKKEVREYDKETKKVNISYKIIDIKE